MNGGLDVPLVGIVARLVPIKAHEVFFAAAARVHERLPAAQFLVIGDGERRAELTALVDRLGLREHVRFLGWRRDMARVYADLDAVALTSRDKGSPVPLIEALAAARPVPRPRWAACRGRHRRPDRSLVPRRSGAVAGAVVTLLCDRPRAERLGQAGGNMSTRATIPVDSWTTCARCTSPSSAPVAARSRRLGVPA